MWTLEETDSEEVTPVPTITENWNNFIALFAGAWDDFVGLVVRLCCPTLNFINATLYWAFKPSLKHLQLFRPSQAILESY